MSLTYEWLRRRARLDKVQSRLAEADRTLADLLLTESTLYATQEAEWQEGDEGHAHCQATDKLAAALAVLRGIELPPAGSFGGHG